MDNEAGEQSTDDLFVLGYLKFRSSDFIMVSTKYLISFAYVTIAFASISLGTLNSVLIT